MILKKFKRKFIILASILVLGLVVTISFFSTKAEEGKPFALPKLPYSYDALEPYIDSKTMEIHYEKHHGAYVEKLNQAVLKYPELKEKSIEELLSNLDNIPQEIKETVRNNGGGHYNHSFFWSIMGKNKGGEPKGTLKKDLDKTFGSVENFKKTFKESALSRFGSGWVWLVKDKNGELKVITTANQDSPIMEGIKPVLGLDLWEHAYYLKYQNKRGDYIDNWWNVVNWNEIEKKYK